MSYELNRHKKSDAVKWVVVFVLILALVAGMLAVFTGGYKNWDVKTWFGQTECQHEYVDGKCTKCGEAEPTPDPVPENPQDNGGAFIGNVAGHGMKLQGVRLMAEEYADYGVAPTAADSYVLSATITPATASNKEVDWSVAWANASSSWASGKTVTDYVTVSSGTSLTTTVTCNQAFAEQVVITCAAKANADIKATCTVDFRERLSSVALTINAGNKDYAINNSTAVPLATSATHNVDITKSVGTIVSTYSSKVSVSLTADYAAALESTYGNSWGTGYDNVNELTGTFSLGSIFANLITPNNWGNVTDAYGPMLEAEIMDWTSNYSGHVLSFSVEVTNGETSAKTNYTYTAPLADIIIPVGGIELGSSSIIF